MPSGVGGGTLSNPPVKPAEGALWVCINGVWQAANTITAQLTIDLGTGQAPAPVQLPTTLVLNVADAATPRIEGRSFGGNGLLLNGVVAGGTRSSPAFAPNGSAFFSLQAYGYDGASINTVPSALYLMLADTDWSGSNKGTYHLWSGTSAASTTRTTWMQLKSAALILGTDPGGTDMVRIGGALTVNDTKLLTSKTTLTDFAAAAAGTLTNAPTAGNPTKWVSINDNGTVRKIPTWT